MSQRSPSETTKVLVVDDHPFTRRGLAHTINDEPDLEVCGEAGDWADALEGIERHRPNVVIVDISLAESNGLELIKEIRARHPEVKVLVSSMHDESLFAERAVRAGALGYVNKNEDPETFVKALRTVLSGRIHLSPRMTDRLLHQLSGLGEGGEKSPIETLSDRELEVFELIGRGLITKQIAAKLDLSRKTVETYREKIKTKLGLANGTELTQQAVGWVVRGG